MMKKMIFNKTKDRNGTGQNQKIFFEFLHVDVLLQDSIRICVEE
jgi:hypothetical protein